MWWWHKVRRANISQELRERFEFYGETVIALVTEGAKVGGGSELMQLSLNHGPEIAAWLKERRDLHARREDRLETVEWAILIFVVVGVVADVLIVMHELGWLH
jgi:hypothetical protein